MHPRPTRRLLRLGGALLLTLGLVVSASAGSAAPSGTSHHRRPPAGPPGPLTIAYFTQWGIYSGYFVKNVETSGSAEQIDVINYAFGNVSEDGRCFIVNEPGVGDAWADFQRPASAAESVDGVADEFDQRLKGNFNQLRKLKARHPDLKVMISLGGFTWSKYFSDAALTPRSRREFVRSCIDLYIKGNLPELGGPTGGRGAGAGVFDGIDVDWEYPASEGAPGNVVRPEDTRNFTLLMREFRRQLNRLGRHTGKRYLLTTALPAGLDKIDKIQVRRASRYLDWINLLTYDIHGPWESTGPTNFHSHLFLSPDDPATGPVRVSVDRVVNEYLDRGAPARKLVVGVPFYGHGWTGVTNANNGLYQPATGPAPGDLAAGTASFRWIDGTFAGTLHRDPATRGVWKFDGTTFWAYDDPQSLAEKAIYVRARGLRGLYAWELSQDDGRLITSMNGALG